MRAVLVVTAVLTACGGPSTYRLVQSDGGLAMVPPRVKRADVSQRTVKLKANPCTPPDLTPPAESRGGKLRVPVDRSLLAEAPAGALVRWGVALESAGCLEPGQGYAAADRIARSTPLSPRQPRTLLNASERNDGYIDLRAGHRIRVAGPVFRDGAPPGAEVYREAEPPRVEGGGITLTLKKSPDVLGFEVDWYGVEAAAPGVRIAPLSAERRIEGEELHLKSPTVNPFSFDPSAAFFRLMFLARLEDDPDHDILMLAAPTPVELERRYKRIKADPTRCADEVAFCVGAAKHVAFVPFVSVRANDRETHLAPGAVLRQALREAGVAAPESVVDSLTVWKPFGDRMARVEFDSDDILNLPLEGGERLVWQAQ